MFHVKHFYYLKSGSFKGIPAFLGYLAGVAAVFLNLNKVSYGLFDRQNHPINLRNFSSQLTKLKEESLISSSTSEPFIAMKVPPLLANGRQNSFNT